MQTIANFSLEHDFVEEILSGDPGTAPMLDNHLLRKVLVDWFQREEGKGLSSSNLGLLVITSKLFNSEENLKLKKPAARSITCNSLVTPQSICRDSFNAIRRGECPKNSHRC